MPTSVINSYYTPESTSAPVVHEDLVRLVKQMMQGDVMRFSSATERDAVFTTLGTSPPVGSLAYLADIDWYTRYTSAAVWAPMPGKLVTESVRTSTVGTFTTTETVLDSVTITALANARYKVYYESVIQSVVANDLVTVNLRYKAGTVADTTGTVLTVKTPNVDVAGRGGLFSMTKTLTGAAAGSLTIVASAVRNSGTGAISSVGSSGQEVILRVSYE